MVANSQQNSQSRKGFLLLRPMHCYVQTTALHHYRDLARAQYTLGHLNSIPFRFTNLIPHLVPTLRGFHYRGFHLCGFFSLCMCYGENFALVESIGQSQQRKFCVTQYSRNQNARTEENRCTEFGQPHRLWVSPKKQIQIRNLDLYALAFIQT